MNNHKNSHLVFSLALLLIFVIGSFFVLLFETKGYSKIQETINNQEGIYMPLSYINTKCKMNNDINIEVIDNIECLVFNDDEMKTYIYYQDGSLKELYASHEYNISLSQGNHLFDVDGFDINIKDDLLDIYIKKGEDAKVMNIYLFNEVMPS